MSWSVCAVGKVAAVANAIEQQFDANGPCSEPEETVRQAAKAMIANALQAQDPNGAVQVSASGSQGSTYTNGSWGPPYTNQLKIDIQPLYGFVQ